MTKGGESAAGGSAPDLDMLEELPRAEKEWWDRAEPQPATAAQKGPNSLNRRSKVEQAELISFVFKSKTVCMKKRNSQRSGEKKLQDKNKNLSKTE